VDLALPNDCDSLIDKGFGMIGSGLHRQQNSSAALPMACQ
jgi:hypothetical protein